MEAGRWHNGQATLAVGRRSRTATGVKVVGGTHEGKGTKNRRVRVWARVSACACGSRTWRTRGSSGSSCSSSSNCSSVTAWECAQLRTSLQYVLP